MDDKKPLTPMHLEKVLAGMLDVPAVAQILGVTSQAVYKRPEWIKREMGGIKTPAGWLFDPEKVKGYQPATGRPAEGRRTAVPFL